MKRPSQSEQIGTRAFPSGKSTNSATMALITRRRNGQQRLTLNSTIDCPSLLFKNYTGDLFHHGKARPSSIGPISSTQENRHLSRLDAAHLLADNNKARQPLSKAQMGKGDTNVNANEIIDSAYAASIQDAFRVLVQNLSDQTPDAAEKFANAVQISGQAGDIARRVLGQGSVAAKPSRARTRARK